LNAFSPTANSGPMAYNKWNPTARICKLPRQPAFCY